MGKQTWKQWNLSQMSDPLWAKARWEIHLKGKVAPIGKIAFEENFYWVKLRGGLATWTKHSTLEDVMQSLHHIQGVQITLIR